MKVDRTRLYDSSDDFFELNGSIIMKLTRTAAQDVCIKALEHGLLVVRIEGGIWHNPGFEARLDCIWDGVDPPVSEAEAMINNAKALEMIREESEVHDAFIITTASIKGYKSHRMR
jgi:hypothetical protein